MNLLLWLCYRNLEGLLASGTTALCTFNLNFSYGETGGGGGGNQTPPWYDTAQKTAEQTASDEATLPCSVSAFLSEDFPDKAPASTKRLVPALRDISGDSDVYCLPGRYLRAASSGWEWNNSLCVHFGTTKTLRAGFRGLRAAEGNFAAAGQTPWNYFQRLRAAGLQSVPYQLYMVWAKLGSSGKTMLSSATTGTSATPCLGRSPGALDLPGTDFHFVTSVIHQFKQMLRYASISLLY
jgi:hypothetical protein